MDFSGWKKSLASQPFGKSMVVQTTDCLSTRTASLMKAIWSAVKGWPFRSSWAICSRREAALRRASK